jgi:hypothetical protein
MSKELHFSTFATQKATAMFISAVSLSAALAWNSAFQSYFDSREELKQKGPWFYALFITIIGVILVFMATKAEHMVVGSE